MDASAKILNYIEKKGKWKELLYNLREILLSTGIDEKVKWGMPVYCINNKNIVGIAAFKDFSGLWFFQGDFLSDPSKLLVNAQEGKTKGMRQWKFYSPDENLDTQLIKSYILEAIQNEKEGKENEAKPRKIVIPDELAKALNEDVILNMKFKQLSKGKQNDYLEYISEAKRPATRTKRLEKSIELILKGKGLNDKYKK